MAIYPQGKHQIIGGAIDIGSTTLALYVYDLKDGQLVLAGATKAVLTPSSLGDVFGVDLQTTFRKRRVLLSKACPCSISWNRSYCDHGDVC